jgi:transposase
MKMFLHLISIIAHAKITHQMKLTKIALLALRGAKDSKRKLAEALDVSEATVYRWISENNDSLTKAAALKVIREETGLTDAEILETEMAG